MEKWVLHSSYFKNPQGKDKDNEEVKKGFFHKKRERTVFERDNLFILRCKNIYFLPGEEGINEKQDEYKRDILVKKIFFHSFHRHGKTKYGEKKTGRKRKRKNFPFFLHKISLVLIYFWIISRMAWVASFSSSPSATRVAMPSPKLGWERRPSMLFRFNTMLSFSKVKRDSKWEAVCASSAALTRSMGSMGFKLMVVFMAFLSPFFGFLFFVCKGHQTPHTVVYAAFPDGRNQRLAKLR